MKLRNSGIVRLLVASALVLPLLVAPTITPSAHAVNTSCSPTTIIPSSGLRAYLFTSTTLCDWIVPAGFETVTVQAFAGGGGGGGGSWAGTHGGGGGGGGAGGLFHKAFVLTTGGRYSIQVGAGGTAGSGASSQGGTTGTAGGNGGSSIFNGTYSAPGGTGGGGGSSDTGGTGGVNGGRGVGTELFGSQNDPHNGGTQVNGNAGGGAAIQYDGYAGQTSIAGEVLSGATFAPRNSVTVGGGGGGGANQNSTANGLPGTAPIGGSSSRAAATSSELATGGGGGHGCAGSSSTCANRDGAAGSSGFIMIYATFSAKFTGTNNSSLKLGSAPTFPVISTTGGIGSITWSVSPALPAGISLDPNTGVFSGTPTATADFYQYRMVPSDSLGTSPNLTAWNMLVGKGDGVRPSLADANIVYNVPTALSATGGIGTGVYKYSSSSANCVLTGTRGETVTAQKASGTCAITVEKQGDANYYAASYSATFTMTKQVATNVLTVSPISPKEENSSITLTATVGAGQTGTVTFTAGGSPISYCGTSGAVTIVGTTATCVWKPAASGSPFTLASTYAGDSNYQSKSSNTISYTIYPSISLSYPDISSTFGSAKSSTPSISGGTGSTSSWSWSIAKTSDASSVSGITINSSGVVTASGSTSVGTYPMTVTATDTVGIAKTASISVVVGLSSAASTTLRSSATTTTAGGTVTLTASVVSAATGTIAFKVGATNISGCSAVTISSGSATCSWTPSTSVGSPFSLTAVYSGDGSYSTSTSAAQSIAVSPAGSFTYASQSYNFGVATTVTPSISGGTGTFSSWTIVNTSDSQSDFNITVNSQGVVTISKTATAGTHNMTITATDGAGVSGSGTLQITIAKVTPTLTFTPKTINDIPLTGGTLGRQVRLVLTSSVPSGGMVTFYGNGSSICTAFMGSGNGECWWAPSDASSSPYSLYAVYAGDSNANGGTSSTISNFAWSPAPTLSYTNRTVETGKSATINPVVSGGSGALSSWSWNFFQNFTGLQIGGIRMGVGGVITVSGATAPGTYLFDVGGYDPTGASAGASITITIANVAPPDISLTSTSETATVNSAITGFTVVNIGSDVGAYDFDITLPAGLVLDATTGALTGTPTETITSTVFTLTAHNAGGIDTATFTLTINSSGGGGGGGGGVTIILSLPGNATTATKSTAVTITADVSVAGKVRFLANGKVIPGCAARGATTATTCVWKPAVQGQMMALVGILSPTSNSYSVTKSATLNVSVGRRTTRR